MRELGKCVPYGFNGSRFLLSYEEISCACMTFSPPKDEICNIIEIFEDMPAYFFLNLTSLSYNFCRKKLYVEGIKNIF